MKRIYSEKVYEKIFISENNTKETYLDVCKWLAVNIYSKPGICDYLNVKILKQENKKKTKTRFVVEIFVCIDEDDMINRYCSKCKQLHTIFYSVDKVNCDVCKLHGYKTKLSREISVLRETFEKRFGNGQDKNINENGN